MQAADPAAGQEPEEAAAPLPPAIRAYNHPTIPALVRTGQYCRNPDPEAEVQPAEPVFCSLAETTGASEADEPLETPFFPSRAAADLLGAAFFAAGALAAAFFAAGAALLFAVAFAGAAGFFAAGAALFFAAAFGAAIFFAGAAFFAAGAFAAVFFAAGAALFFALVFALAFAGAAGFFADALAGAEAAAFFADADFFAVAGLAAVLFAGAFFTAAFIAIGIAPRLVLVVESSVLTVELLLDTAWSSRAWIETALLWRADVASFHRREQNSGKGKRNACGIHRPNWSGPRRESWC